MMQNNDYEVQRSDTLYLLFFFWSLCLYYVTDLIKKLDYVYWLLLFLVRIKFGHAQITVTKIGIPMSETVCINPWMSDVVSCQWAEVDFRIVK